MPGHLTAAADAPRFALDRLSGESDRLAALRSFEVLDTGRDARLDAITRCAARIFGAPIAAVSLLDGDRLWAKSLIGCDIRQTPRHLAFSPSLLDMPGPVMVVEDASRDGRFAHIPLVAGPLQVRFYAGTKLLDSSGHLLGTLCVMDRKPAAASQGQLDQLTDLGSAAVAALELHRIETALRHSATRDSITGLPSRASFMAQAAVELAGATGHGSSMLTVDLGRFSDMTELAGHAGGEELLQDAARRLLAIIGPHGIATRLGGDEFGVLVPAAGAEATQALADEIIDGLTRPFHLAEEVVLLRPSVGIAGFPGDARTAEDLVRRSRDALYWAKRRGRNRAYVFDAGLHRDLVGRQLLERDLRAALVNGAFLLEWQPVVSATAGRLIGYEALLRWDRPGHGRVPPAEAMATAGACGLAGPIDNWVLDAACAAAAAWPGQQVASVNLSVAGFEQAGIVALVARTLAAHGLPPSRLQLEIDFQAFTAQDGEAVSKASALRDMGVGVALNNFGASGSLLGRLKDLPFGKIKLCRTLLDQVGTSDRANAVTYGALQLGKALGVTLCATGVETLAEYAFLAEHGCDEVQGHFVAPPDAAPADPRFVRVAMSVQSDPADSEDPLRGARGVAAAVAVSGATLLGILAGLRHLLP